MRRRIALGLLVASALPARGQDLGQRLHEGGLAIVMRHTRTEAGTGDPPSYRLGDCSTQRNLSEAGRQQARATGAAWRELGVPVRDVLTSAWCRCIETGRLLGFDEPLHLAALDSFFDERSRRDRQTDELRRWLAGRDPSGVAVLVTHQVNVTALTGVFPRSGEAVVVDAGAGVLGRLGPYG